MLQLTGTVLLRHAGTQSIRPLHHVKFLRLVYTARASSKNLSRTTSSLLGFYLISHFGLSFILLQPSPNASVVLIYILLAIHTNSPCFDKLAGTGGGPIFAIPSMCRRRRAAKTGETGVLPPARRWRVPQPTGLAVGGRGAAWGAASTAWGAAWVPARLRYPRLGASAPPARHASLGPSPSRRSRTSSGGPAAATTAAPPRSWRPGRRRVGFYAPVAHRHALRSAPCGRRSVARRPAACF
jgi:preprotein translocase subunit SecG